MTNWHGVRKHWTPPAAQFAPGVGVKPAEGCNNGTWTKTVTGVCQYLHGEWWYDLDGTWYAESELQLA